MPNFDFALVPLDRLNDVLRIQSDMLRLHHATHRRLDQLSQHIQRLTRLEIAMSKEMDDLIAEVAADRAVDESAMTLLEQISKKLEEAGTDRVKLAQLANDLKTNREAMAAAVIKNTPASDTPPADNPPPAELPAETPLTPPPSDPRDPTNT